jgi:hypothetical protein
MWEWRYNYTILASALRGGVGSASHTRGFTLGERIPSPSYLLDMRLGGPDVEKRKTLVANGNRIPAVHNVARLLSTELSRLPFELMFLENQ